MVPRCEKESCPEPDRNPMVKRREKNDIKRLSLDPDGPVLPEKEGIFGGL